MEGIRLAQILGKIMDSLYNVHNEVQNFGQGTHTRIQDLAYKVQLILDWCE